MGKVKSTASRPCFFTYPFLGAALVLCLALCAVLLLRYNSNETRGPSSVQHPSGAPEISTRKKIPTTSEGMRRDHEFRLKEAVSRGRQKPTNEFVRWLHVPKTGTSFVNTMIRWGCTDIPPELFIMPRMERPKDLTLSLQPTFWWDWLILNDSGREWTRKHCPERLVTISPVTLEASYSLHLHRELRPWETHKTAAFFRIPRQRVYSWYAHIASRRERYGRIREGLRTFIRRPDMTSHHAKLLLGRRYNDKLNVSTNDARKAANIVSHGLGFVGLTEEFDLSCRLFHAKYGGVPHQAQFENVRPGRFRYENGEKGPDSFSYNESEFQGWRDVADDVVYEAAKKRFWNDVRAQKDDIEADGLGPVVVKSS